jgi:hypothetical protein
VPQSIERLAVALSIQLTAIDEIAQLIRDELNKCPSKAHKIKDSDDVSPQRLALLYNTHFGEDIYEWMLVDWIQTLEEAEVEKVGEVRTLLKDGKVRKKLDKLSKRIRGFRLEASEWAVYSALVVTETTKTAGERAVEKRIQEEWDEIVATARREALSELPDSLEEFVEMLGSGDFPTDAIRELGGIQGCDRCGVAILRPEQAAEAVLDYYGNPDLDVDIEGLLAETVASDAPEVESVDYSGLCQYCGHQATNYN